MGTKNWTHKVVKQARGEQGKFFSFPAAGTFDGEQAAREYAREFAVEQASVGGVQIDVRARGGKLVARYLTRNGTVVDACAVR